MARRKGGERGMEAEDRGRFGGVGYLGRFLEGLNQVSNHPPGVPWGRRSLLERLCLESVVSGRHSLKTRGIPIGRQAEAL